MSIPISACPVCGGPVHSIGRVLVDSEGGWVHGSNGAKASLSPSQMIMFGALWFGRPKAQTREHLLFVTSKPGRDDDREVNAVSVQMHHLRKRLAPLGITIETLKGEHGYRIINSEAGRDVSTAHSAKDENRGEPWLKTA